MIEIIAGTNRPNSNTLRIARTVHGLYKKAGVEAQLLSLEDLPPEIFLPSSYAEKPAAFAPIGDRILKSHGLHFVVPEYNGSFPGVLKYFIDMLPFPKSFEHRPMCFTGLSAGLFGALRGLEQLQMICGYRNAHVLPERVLMPNISQKFDENGELRDSELLERLEGQVSAFSRFVTRIKG